MITIGKFSVTGYHFFLKNALINLFTHVRYNPLMLPSQNYAIKAHYYRPNVRLITVISWGDPFFISKEENMNHVEI